MKITSYNFENNTQKIIDTPFTLLQYAKINCCGFFKIKKISNNEILLIDPFSNNPAFKFSKGGAQCI